VPGLERGVRVERGDLAISCKDSEARAPARYLFARALRAGDGHDNGGIESTTSTCHQGLEYSRVCSIDH
jgi:hypothetical protein